MSVPYIIRIIGLEKFGVINFAAAYAGFFVILCDFGFNVTANREIARNQNDHEAISAVAGSVYIIKTGLFLFSAVIFLALIFLLPDLFGYRVIFLLGLGNLLGNYLFPVWLLKGMEKMFSVALINVAVKSLMTIFIFLTVKKESDFILYAFLLNGAFILTGITGFVYGFLITKVKLKFPSLDTLKKYFKEGLYVFYSIVSMNLFSVLGPFILGIFADFRLVGFYSSAEKIITGLLRVITAFTESTYPRITNVLSADHDKGVALIKEVLKITFVVAVIPALILFFAADVVILLLTGEKVSDISLLVRLMSPILLLSPFSGVLGIQTLLNMNYSKEYLKVFLYSILIFMVFSFILVPALYQTGTALTSLLTEAYIFSAMLIIVIRKKLLKPSAALNNDRQYD